MSFYTKTCIYAFSAVLLEGHAKPAENACLSAENARLSTQRHEKPTENACRSIERRAKPAENQLKMHVVLL